MQSLPLTWCLKLVIGLSLIAHMGWMAFEPTRMPALFSLPYAVFLALVLVGGLVTIHHDLLLRRALRAAGGHPVLVCNGGWYARIRHPAYLGDAVLYTGLALYPATLISLGLLVVGGWAIHRQACREDHDLAARFGTEHAQWRSRTGRFWPV